MKAAACSLPVLCAMALGMLAVNGCGVAGSSKTAQSIVSAVLPIVSCSANPASVAAGGSSTISTKAISPTGLAFSYSYSASGGSIANQGSSAVLSTQGASGSITITCKAVDTQGNAGTFTTSVLIQPEVAAPPTVACSANPTSVTLGGAATLTAIGTSPQGRALSYRWSATSGTIAGTGSSVTLATAGASAGTITITCAVADTQGLTANATTTVAVVAPVAPAPPVESAPPTVSCSAEPSILDQGGTAVITATGSSPRGLPLTYSYLASAGSMSGTGASASLETSGATAGVVTVTCVADQQGGGTAIATTSVLLQSVTGEQALTAFQFTDSVGVNMHLAYGDTVYGSQFAQILQSMLDLGVKHYRDGLNQYAPPFQYANAEALGKAGIKANWLMDLHNSAAVINSAYANAPDVTAAFEGPNEEDANAGATLLAFMQLLHQTVRSNPATAAMPILAPSFTQPASYQTQGSFGSLVDFGNTHDYFGTRNPETAPYGGSYYDCGGYGSMQFNICLAQMTGADQPVISTETGYQSGAGLSDAIIGRYEVRTLFESLRLGISRTFLYEFIDDPSGHWGLLTESFSPRPAYMAIKSLLALLKDAGFTHPGKLDYRLTGATQNVHHLLLQKGDGTYYLAIWLAVQSADPNNPSNAYAGNAQNVSLTATTPIGSFTLHTLDDNGNMISSPSTPIGGSLPIAVTDRITLVALSPGQSH